MKKLMRFMETVLTLRPLRKWARGKIIVSKIIKWTSKANNPVIIYVSDFDLMNPLVQRPHHMLRLLAKAGYPVVCRAKTRYVRNDVDNLYLIPKVALKPLMANEKFSKILLFSFGTPIADYKINDDSVYFYEFIDDYDLFNDEEHAQKHIAMFKKITASPNVWTLVSANALYDKAIEYGVPKERIIFSKNAVNVEDFCAPSSVVPQAMESIVNKGKPIIGYYGALTVMWFDFDLMLELVRSRPEWEFVFIGLIYDDPKTKKETEERIANLQKFKNFTYIPPIKYEEIPSYAYNFSVAIIPFQINEITKGTNPVKLFEYMAMGLPIVTTPMPECKLYESVFIADGLDDFSLAIANAIPLKDDSEYQKILKRETSENTWAARVDDMVRIIKKHNKTIPMGKKSNIDHVI